MFESTIMVAGVLLVLAWDCRANRWEYVPALSLELSDHHASVYELAGGE
jgi:hypothetical protein